MAHAFKKGQEVTYISDWDSKGTVYYRQAVVYSCGKKQMVLTDAETGEEMGRHFAPEIGALEVSIEGFSAKRAGGTFPRMTDAEAVEAGMKVAASIQQYERHCFARCLAGSNSEGYKAATQRDIDALHDLNVIKR